MDRWSQNKTEVARAIWSRLTGCFGEALLRKFGPEPPDEWIAGLSGLTAAQHERGLRRLVFGWKGPPPSLPDFMRLCRSIGTDEFDEGQPEQPRLPAPDTWQGDNWDMAANRYLMGHIAKRMSNNPKFYGEDGSDEFVGQVRKLVTAKQSWAADMRDLAVNNEVPPSTQKAVWYDLMNTAEKRA